MLRSAAAVVVVALIFPLASSAGAGALQTGDRAWSRRAEGATDSHARPGPIGEAIRAYRQAIEESPEDLEPRWKLLRALYFEGQFVALDREGKRQVFEESRRVAEEALDLLAQAVGGREKLDRMEPGEKAKALGGQPEAAPVFFWSAVDWGLWGESVGRLKAARQGVGGRVRDDAEAVIALDESYENAGGHRLLGRLHAVAPRVPFFTGWVDRAKALEELRRAVELGPDEPYNALYLAEAILDHRPQDRSEALRLLEELAERAPRPGHRVEDAFVLAQARSLLAEIAGS